MTVDRVGFVGLGNMGGPMAANIAKAGIPMVVYDAAGTEQRAPAGAACARSVTEVAAECDLMLMSLPNVAASKAVAEEIRSSNTRRVAVVADTSTVGVDAAVAIHARLAEAGIPYVDAPVSGMVEGAREGTLSVMYSGPKAALERLRPVFMAMGRNVFDMGEKPGQGQAMKVLNNYLALLSLFATSEALTFGRAMDLDLKQMVDVLNVSSGRNIASMAMFPAWVLTGTMRGGFPAKGVVKDIGGFMEGARSLDTPRAIAEALEATVGRFNDAGPDTDMAHAWTWTLAQAKGAVT